jgi:hypothetical protein
MRVNGQRVSRLGSQSPAERLYQIEKRERFLCERMHKDRLERNQLQAEISRLRCSLDDEDIIAYKRLCFVRDGRE